MLATAIHLPQTVRVESLKREYRSRNNVAYIVYDVRTGTLLLTQKLQHAVLHINSALAQSRHERVTHQGMYEAIDTMQNTLEGWHKHR